MLNIIKPAAALLLITLACALLLGFVYEITKKPIEEAEVKAKTEALKRLLPNADTFTPLGLPEGGVDTDFALITELTEAADKNGEPIGVCVFAETKGYGGTIGVLTAIDTEGCIIGVTLVTSSETPGLGSLAGEAPFLNGFINKNSTVTVTKGEPGDTEIAAVSGATITSNAVTACVNAALVYVNENTYVGRT